MAKFPLRPLPLLSVAAAILAAAIFLPKLNKPKESTSPKVYSNLFVYEDIINKIGAFAVDHKFIIDKSITIKGFPAHLLEYNTGDPGLLIHHTDIFTVKNGYFINISAYTYEWAWPEFVDSIEKSFNTISFSPK